MATTTKKERLTDARLRTPKGQFQWAYLNKPDDAFNKRQYRTTLYFLDKKDPEYIAFVAAMKRLAKEYAQQVGKAIKSVDIPLKVATESQAEKAGVPVGTPFIEAKTHAVDKDGKEKGPVAIFDATGKKDMSLLVYGGDIGRLEIMVAGYDAVAPIGTGLTLYLNAAQLLKKGTGRGSTGSTFEQEDEFLSSLDDDSPDNEADPDEFEDEDAFEDESSDDEGDDPTAGLL